MSQTLSALPVLHDSSPIVADAQASPVSRRTVPCDVVTRRLYFRGLGIVYLIAFLSLWIQIHPLIGEQGLLPISRYLKLAQEQLGGRAVQLLPTLLWFGAGDAMLHLWCVLGTALSVCLIVGLAPRIALMGLWTIYLSLSVAGQAFLSFQWDTLLLEMTVCSILYAPRGLRPQWQAAAGPLPAARWLLWALAFKLMFLSGVTKLLSGDSSWSDGTALQFHYYTQPIPNWISWYAYQFPLGIHQLSLWLMFVIEVLLPFLVLAGYRGRAVFGLSTVMLMGVIELTGNFGFFNLMTAVLCIPLLNDPFLQRCLPRSFARLSTKSESDHSQSSGADSVFVRSLLNNVKPVDAVRSRLELRTLCGHGIVAVVLSISLLTLVREMVRTQQANKMPKFVVATLGLADNCLLSWSEPTVLKVLAPFRTINGYGLFRVMTTHRPEIIVEISDDGEAWTACEFPYKPGQVDRAPPIVAPHMPRLDWQMWFAALNPRGNSDWLSSLTERILEGNPGTARLLGRPELVAQPPKFVRLAYYEYKFSSPDQKQNTGAWWSRSHTGYLTGPLSRRP